jgi:hypothetical protein
MPSLLQNMCLTLLVSISAVSIKATSISNSWVHPGVLLGEKQLSFIMNQLSNNSLPFNASLEKALSYTWINSKTKASMSSDWNGTISCGFFDSHDYGCGNATNDGESALLDAYLWAITKDTKWSSRAITILNYYATNLKQFANSGNGPLVAAWTADMWARAAEILSSTGANWGQSDINAFGSMLVNANLPLIYPVSCDNGNWHLSMIEGMIGISVFTENSTLFHYALDNWKIRVPAYFYIDDDGPTHLPGPAVCGKYNPYWYNQLVFNSSVNGVSQETCRDFGHTAYGLASTFNVAETALLQGIDLYTPNKKRLAAALEFHAGFLNAGAEKGWPKNPYSKPSLNITSPFVCNNTQLHLGYSATYQVGLTGMTRLGINLPETTKYVQEWVWKLSAGDQMGQYMYMYEPLTHGAPAPAT